MVCNVRVSGAGNNIQAQGVQLLAQVLPQLPNLTHLDMSGGSRSFLLLLLTLLLFCICAVLLTCCLFADKYKYTFIAAANVVVVVVLPIRQLHGTGWSTCVGGCAATVDAAVCVEFR